MAKASDASSPERDERRAGALQGLRRAWPWYALAAAVVAVDQWSKLLAVRHLELHDPLALAPFFNLTLTYNTGAAFSFLSEAGGWQRWLFSGLAVLVSGFIAVWLARVPSGQRLLALALALVLGGALGNLWDRLTLGVVIDFLDFYLGFDLPPLCERGCHWPAFNVADSAITIGAVLLAWTAFRDEDAAE